MAGKGSMRRPCDESKVSSNWDLIFSKPKAAKKAMTQKEAEDKYNRAQRAILDKQKQQEPKVWS